MTATDRLDRLRRHLKAAADLTAEAIIATHIADLPRDTIRRQIAHARTRLRRAEHQLDKLTNGDDQ